MLGDGGTTDVARRAVDWAIERFPLMMAERTLAELVGVNEAAGLLETSRANVLRWSNGQGRTDMPDPVLTLACGPHWSVATLAEWASVDQDHSVAETGNRG